jgi:alpha-methylacyl-CoA racemase
MTDADVKSGNPADGPPGEGPLTGLRVLEMPGIGPLPLAGMLLGDLGAEVIRVDRVESVDREPQALIEELLTTRDHMGRGRSRIAVDLAKQDGREVLLRLVETTDVLIEGFRPGVMERLGLGPEVCLARRPGLVYGRMTGWGRVGPYAQVAGHDVNYVGTTGLLDATGSEGAPPTTPLGVVGDFGGGTMFLIMGVLSALLERERSGLGQVVDAAIVDGVALLDTLGRYVDQRGGRPGERGTNELDGGSHFYNSYMTKDGKWLSVGAIEPRFYENLLKVIDPDGTVEVDQLDPATWSFAKTRFSEIFASRTQEEWLDSLAGTDSCVAPVLTYKEAPYFAHNVARDAYIEVDGQMHAAPAPRFSRSSLRHPQATHTPGEDTVAVLEALGLSTNEVKRLIDTGAVKSPGGAGKSTPASELRGKG